MITSEDPEPTIEEIMEAHARWRKNAMWICAGIISGGLWYLLGNTVIKIIHLIF